MHSPDHEPSTLPWFRDELMKKMAALEQEISSHRHTLDLLRQTENSYGHFVPHQLLKLLNVESILDLSLGEHTERQMTISFSDIREFTNMSDSMSPQQTFSFLNSYLGEMEPVISRHAGIVDKFIGDAIMAIFPSSADDGVQSAIAMLDQLNIYNGGRTRAGYQPISLGTGLNTGIVMLGIVGGTQRREGTVVGDAVNVASKIESTTKIYKTPLLISESTLTALADSGKYRIRFLDRIRIAGKNHPQSAYEVFDNDPEQIRSGKEASRARFEEAVAYYHLKAAEKAVPLLESCVRDVPEDFPAQLYLERCNCYLKTGHHENVEAISGNLEWGDELLVGVPQIDAEHKELVASMNNLAANIRSGDSSGINAILSFLEDYTHFHFGNEEEIMQAVRYPLMNDHLHEHRKFVEQLARLRRDIESGLHDPLYLGFQIQLVLFDWFANHITKTDRHLGKFMLTSKKSH